MMGINANMIKSTKQRYYEDVLDITIIIAHVPLFGLRSKLSIQLRAINKLLECNLNYLKINELLFINWNYIFEMLQKMLCKVSFEFLSHNFTQKTMTIEITFLINLRFQRFMGQREIKSYLEAAKIFVVGSVIVSWWVVLVFFLPPPSSNTLVYFISMFLLSPLLCLEEAPLLLFFVDGLLSVSLLVLCGLIIEVSFNAFSYYIQNDKKERRKYIVFLKVELTTNNIYIFR